MFRPRTHEGRSGLTNIDLFAAFNVLLLVLMCIFVYYDRFVAYRGPGNTAEFLLYAVFIMAVIVVFWSYLRKYSFDAWMLMLVEMGILMHFSGGLVHMEGTRLYDHLFFGIRFDKYVHFINSFTACVITHRIFLTLRVALHKVHDFVVVTTVLGYGAVIEILEYVVTRTIPHNGVGDYDNNMQDLISNLAGGLFFVIVRHLRRCAFPRHTGRADGRE